MYIYVQVNQLPRTIFYTANMYVKTLTMKRFSDRRENIGKRYDAISRPRTDSLDNTQSCMEIRNLATKDRCNSLQINRFIRDGLDGGRLTPGPGEGRTECSRSLSQHCLKSGCVISITTVLPQHGRLRATILF